MRCSGIQCHLRFKLLVWDGLLSVRQAGFAHTLGKMGNLYTVASVGK